MGTNWRRLSLRHGFVVVFAQGQGNFLTDGPTRDKYGAIVWGDLYWGIEDPEEDFKYFEEVIESVNSYLPIDPSRVYYVGYSNGGMFSCNLAIRYGHKLFSGICNMMGGWGGEGGYDEGKMLDVSEAEYPVKMLIISGTLDPYLPACLRAKQLFEARGFPVTLDVIEGANHSYRREKEELIWEFFNQKN